MDGRWCLNTGGGVLIHFFTVAAIKRLSQEIDPTKLSDLDYYPLVKAGERFPINDPKHSRGAPYHPQTQGKIERWHQTLKNRILLENYFLPGDLEAQIEAFVDHYNHQALSREHQQRHTSRRLLWP